VKQMKDIFSEELDSLNEQKEREARSFARGAIDEILKLTARIAVDQKRIAEIQKSLREFEMPKPVTISLGE
jgi:hypothetical protein